MWDVKGSSHCCDLTLCLILCRQVCGMLSPAKCAPNVCVCVFLPKIPRYLSIAQAMDMWGWRDGGGVRGTVVGLEGQRMSCPKLRMFGGGGMVMGLEG